ncbi:MAG: hypothetical protein BGO51_05690 [Rhodospirillales bacterium 69-11]|nr:hypothetical protein [Rhodospirillales bacterium]MBN8928209.1 hypothetical protein [Rhodospirillales bacterium]OJW27214.1 MAG: hypothetical protein BGO51_05690 [Rhodospirillales bacterium 69-11]
MSRPLASLWQDAAFRSALMRDPRPALHDLGIQIPPDIAVRTLGSRGAPSDGMDTLLQVMLERGRHFTYFFIPSPTHKSAQQAAYGGQIGSRVDDPVFAQRVRQDAETALRTLAALPA